MALEQSSPHMGDIGDEEPTEETDPDRHYEREVENEREEKPKQSDS